jgi:hypothetical protein
MGWIFKKKEVLKEYESFSGTVTEFTKHFCKIRGVEYTETARKNINKIIKSSQPKEEDNLIKNIDQSEIYKQAEKAKRKKSDFYLITCAQAHTPINSTVWEGMKAYAEEIGAQIIVVPITYYNNKTSFKPYPTIWHPELLPYMFAREDKIHPYLTLISDANVLPTAERPLRGFEGVTGEESSIVGHPRHHLEVVPTLPNSRDKFMMTTGAITIPNYRKARVGKKAEFHHIEGFLVVEILSNEAFNFRHVSSCEDGSFQDLVYTWDGKKIKKDGRAECIIFGDVHVGQEDPEMIEKTRDVLDILNPKSIVLHDIFDGHSINHHQAKDFVHQVKLEKSGKNDLESEIGEVFSFIDSFKEWNPVIVPSNHNDWLDKWLRLGGGDKDIKNAIIFNELRWELYNNDCAKGILAHLIDREKKVNKTWRGVKTLHRNDSYKVCGHELNNHGDLGSNGAKGTPNTFRKLNVKIVSGDKHFLYTLDGAYGVGVSTVKDHGYNRGLSSWTQSHGVINANGKFQHLIFSGNKFSNLLG